MLGKHSHECAVRSQLGSDRAAPMVRPIYPAAGTAQLPFPQIHGNTW